MGDRDRRLIRVLRTADTVADSGGWNFKARVTVKVRGADEKGMPDQKEQHKTRRRGRLLKAAAGFYSVSQSFDVVSEYSGII